MLTKPFTVRLLSDPDQVGIVVSEHLLPTPSPENPQKIEYKCQLGVLWDSQRSPCITYWSPEDLEWVAVMDMIAAEEYDEEDEEEDDEEEEEENTEDVADETEEAQTVKQ